jgi:DNA ligase-1
MGRIQEAFTVLQLIGETTSRTDKETLLKNNKNNEVLSKILRWTYDPNLIYFIKKIDCSYGILGDSDEYTYEKNLQVFSQVLTDLASRTITGNNAIETIKTFFKGCNNTEYTWYCKVIQKDFKIGITETTINKIFGKGFIPVYSCILADKMTKIEDLPEVFYIEPKLDGMRINAWNYDTGVVLRSRNGKLITGFDELEHQIHNLLPKGFVYDGEIMSKGFITSMDSKSKTADGFNSLMQQAFKKTKGKTGVLNMFDQIPIREFEKQTSSYNQLERKLSLMGFYNEIDAGVDSSAISVVPHMGIFHKNSEIDIKAMYQLYDMYLKSGFEGGMVKQADMPYEYKRTKKLLKIKPKETYDLKVIRLEPGKPGTKYESTLGTAVVDFNGFEVKVPGFKEEMRDFYWNNPQELIGKTIEVEAQEETTNKQGGRSLRFPEFKGVRYDKE